MQRKGWGYLTEKLKYSPDAIEKLYEIKKDITVKYGAKTAKVMIAKMTKFFRDLQKFENKGLSVESVRGIPCEYRLLYVQHNDAFIVLRMTRYGL